LPKLAEACIEQLQRVQPHGPYHFAGFCFGGNLGFEMARQLAAKGEEVALLAMLSSHYHAGMKRRRNPRLKHWPYHLRQLSTHGWPYLSLKIRDRKNKLVPVPPAAPGNHSGAAPTWDTTENAILQSDFTRALLGRYTASPVPVNVLLFRGISDPPPLKWEYDPNYGWKDLVAGNLLLEDVFCSHSGLVQDAQISEIAGRLRRHFAKSAAGVPASSGG
jgi:thioesterase domain-containing protein